MTVFSICVDATNFFAASKELGYVMIVRDDQGIFVVALILS